MAAPRVFVSSTCYDLRYIRENLRFFIKNMGFEPILSEEGSVYYDPKLHVQDACLAEVPNCQMFVLIIGGRLGSRYKDKSDSIVNQEYRIAAEKRIPVFAMVEQQVQAEYRVYQKNRENKNVDASKIDYPGVDSTKIFDFMEEVQSKAVNNALVPFSDFNELESYLKQQWAGMMFSFLTRKSESERVADTLETLTTMSNRIEFLSKAILSSVGEDIEKINAELYGLMSASKSDMLTMMSKLLYGRSISPVEVVRAIDLDALIQQARAISIADKYDVKLNTPHGSYFFPKKIYDFYKSDYEKVRKSLLDALADHKMKPVEFIKAIEERNL